MYGHNVQTALKNLSKCFTVRVTKFCRLFVNASWIKFDASDLDMKSQVKKTNSELAIIPGGLTKELQPLDIGVNRAFKAKLRAAWEQWMTEGDHTFTKTGRQRRASYATICQWIVDAWAKVSVSTVVRAFKKAGIINEQPSNSNETESDDDERDPGVLDAAIAQLLNSDTEDEEFEGFVEEE